MTEKIGSNVLNYQSMPPMSAKKKKEIEAKLKEEKTKREQKGEDADKQKLPKLTTPGETPPEPVAGEADYEKMVHVDSHIRGRPRKKKQAVEEI